MPLKLVCKYGDDEIVTKVKFEEALVDTDHMLEAFIRFLLACGFQKESINDSICEKAREINKNYSGILE